MKKTILLLIGLMLTSVAFSQPEGQYQVFERISLIETRNEWTVANSLFKTIDGDSCILAYEPLNVKKTNKVYFYVVKDKDLYIFRKDSDGWKKASSLIRHDCYNAESFIMLDAVTNKNDPRSTNKEGEEEYGIVKYESDGKIIIKFKSDVWNKGEPTWHEIFNTLVLTPNSDKTYNFTLK